MKTIHLNQARFERLLEEKAPVLVDFWAPWCGHCRRIEEVYEEVARAYAGDLVAARVNIDDEEALARREGITVIPTLVLYQKGRAPVCITAPKSREEIDRFLREHLKSGRNRDGV